MLSMSVTVRRTSWTKVLPTSNSSKYFPPKRALLSLSRANARKSCPPACLTRHSVDPRPKRGHHLGPIGLVQHLVTRAAVYMPGHIREARFAIAIDQRTEPCEIGVHRVAIPHKQK